MNTPALKILDLGLIDYQEAYVLQRQWVTRVIAGEDPILLLCEHPPTLTLGRAGHANNILAKDDVLASQGIAIYTIDRGGDITLHAPGQLILYPILDLQNIRKDLHFYLHQLEVLAIDLLNEFDIVAHRISGKTGVWVEDKKIVSMGVGVRKWVSYHGLAINVNINLELFQMIRPCGMDVEMTSMHALMGKPCDMDDVKTFMVGCFKKIFQFDNIKREILNDKGDVTRIR